MKKVIYILIAVLIGLLSFCLYLLYVNKHPKIITTVTEKIDTTYISKTDTIFRNNYYRLPSRIDTFIIFKENTDTLYIHGIAIDTINIDSLRLELTGSETIIRDSIFITNEYVKEERFSLDLGANVYPMIDGSNKWDIGLKIGLNTRHGNSFELGYNFINKQVNIGYRKKVFSVKR